ncbi:response regulator [Thiohalobacter sp. IOR34]|uniref:response regulator n=1 Tax=Thiohalobacter sp. IOR34 TaxID=3057176 RepID=UPI0025B024D9|nr:response regulator [Thiohalobacter sp. IOR34]WJW74389.1 response regulator [Thiohalobacter sp. IOR34]
MAPDDTDKPPTEDYLSPHQVASLLHVSPVTVRHWAAQGKLSFVTTPGGHRRFPRAEVERLRRAQEGVGGGTRVLVVDDDRQLVGFLLEWLASLPEPLLTESAFDGFEAGRKLIEFRPQIVLLDLMMPGMDGFSVCRQIKEGNGGEAVRVITMTGYHTPENVRWARASGADACLSKPLDRDLLLKEMGLAGPG